MHRNLAGNFETRSHPNREPEQHMSPLLTSARVRNAKDFLHRLPVINMKYNMKNLCKCVFVEGKLRAVVSHQTDQDQVQSSTRQQKARKLLMFHDKEQPQQLHWVIFVTKGKTVSFELTTAGPR